MTYIYLLAGLIPVAILVGIIYIWSKKENEKIIASDRRRDG